MISFRIFNLERGLSNVRRESARYASKSKFSKGEKKDESSKASCNPQKYDRKFELSEKGKLVMQQYPDRFWVKERRQGNLYVAEEAVASEIAKAVSEEENDVYVFEANPGPGILTKALLEAGLPHLKIFEKESKFIPALKDLQETYPESLDVLAKNIMYLPSLLAKDTSSDCSEAFCNSLQNKKWSDGISFKLVFVLSSSKSLNFMRYLFVKLSTMTSLFQYGRCQFFILLSESEYMHMTALPQKNLNHYRDTTLFYNLFFDIKYLREFPLTAFVPEPKKKKKMPEKLHFVRLTPKKDLLNSVAPVNKLPELYFFIRHHFAKRKSYIIPSLEQWIPLCGPRLIKKGMTVFRKFGDLNPSQILLLFQQFSAMPEYEDSPFRAAAEHFHEKDENYES